MTQDSKRWVFLRNTKCTFFTISCFSETRRGEKEPLRGEKSGQYLLRPQVLMVRSHRQQQPSGDPYTWVTGHWS